MKIALWSSALSIYQKSVTNLQEPPAGFAYTFPGDPGADILMATDVDKAWMDRFIEETAGDKRKKVLWRIEARWLTPSVWPEHVFDLVLSHDWADRGSVYLPFVGTWIRGEPDLTKEYMVSCIASAKDSAGIDGYTMRKAACQFFGGFWEHGYGDRFRRHVEDKADGLAPYRFSVAIESQKYPWYHTEKLFDCFATKTVPLYWGCDDFSKLTEWGYDPAGILPWTTPEELAHLVGSLSVERYESMRAAIHANYERTKELYCTEVALEKVLRESL